MLPSGSKGYVVQYRAGRRSRRISLGPNTVLTCEQTRTRAITIVAAARNGQDPAAERDAGRKAITIKELAERFDHEHIALRVKASTGKEYRRNLQRFILPACQLTVTGVTRADVAKFHHNLRHTFASAAVASGQGLPMFGKLVGHTQVQTTARYAHLAAEPVKMAADAVARDLRQSLGLIPEGTGLRSNLIHLSP